jgi:hypothetical protein
MRVPLSLSLSLSHFSFAFALARLAPWWELGAASGAAAAPPPCFVLRVSCVPIAHRVDVDVDVVINAQKKWPRLLRM